MNIGYARVSSSDQNEARQIDALQKAGCEKIYLDKVSGKDFERPQYKKMVRALKEGDVLFVQALDRFGRDYELVVQQWKYITGKKKAHIVVLDMPILDTRTGQGLVGKFISDIVVQLLAYVAQTERENIRERQAQGIKLAKRRGVKFGHKTLPLPAGFHDACMNVLYGKSSLTAESKKLGMSRTTFCTKYRIWEATFSDKPKKFQNGKNIGIMPESFPPAYEKYKTGELIDLTELSREANITHETLKRYFNFWRRQCDGDQVRENLHA